MFVGKLKHCLPISKLTRQSAFNSICTKIAYNIHIESFTTPNPNFLKFVPQNTNIMGEKGTMDISSQKFAQASPLAQELFKVEGITRVFLGTDYVSIAKAEGTEWTAIKSEIYSIMNDFIENKKPLLSAQALLKQEDEIDPNDTQTVQFIKEIIATRIRPTVEEDGGDVRFVSFDEDSGILTLKMLGACSGCPSSAVTLKQGIEKMLTYYIKEIKQVVSQDE